MINVEVGKGRIKMAKVKVVKALEAKRMKLANVMVVSVCWRW
jgi:hypothetical protein